MDWKEYLKNGYGPPTDPFKGVKDVTKLSPQKRKDLAKHLSMNSMGDLISWEHEYSKKLKDAKKSRDKNAIKIADAKLKIVFDAQVFKEKFLERD